MVIVHYVVLKGASIRREKHAICLNLSEFLLNDAFLKFSHIMYRIVRVKEILVVVKKSMRTKRD